MKFKGTFSDRGLRTLQKGLLPTLEKFGKTCQLLLGPEEVCFVQSSQDTDGMKISATFFVAALFDTDTYTVISRNHNLVAFSCEVQVMLRVLKAAETNAADSLEVKLSMRAMPAAAGTQPVPKPYLSFASKGHNLNMHQNLPVSRPYTPSLIEELKRNMEVTQLCLYYLDLQPEVTRLQAIAEKMKGISSNLTLTLTRTGDLHIQVTGSSVQLAVEVRGLKVVPSNQADAATQLRAATPEARLQEAQQNGDTLHALVQQKHFARSLSSSQHTGPAQLLCGIAEGGFMHFMLAYRDPVQGSDSFDDAVNISLRLPVRDE